MGIFGKLFKGLTVDESERRVAEVGRWAREIPGVISIGSVTARDVVKVAGVVERLRLRPQRGVPAIEATLNDGTGVCTAVWMGRRSMRGLTLGRRMVIEGRLASKDGDYQIMNPTFEFADQRHIEEFSKRKQ